MTHYSEEDLILHYYGEADRDSRIGDHLTLCAACAERYRDLADTLQVLQFADVPVREDQYGLEVWHRIRSRLPEPDASWWSLWFRWNRLGLAAAAMLLVITGFVAGRLWMPPTREGARPGLASLTAEQADEARRRVLLLSVADHLERSDRVLTDITNAAGGGDISAEQGWADDLLSTSRLYRQDAVDADERSIAAVLDELERALLEIVHSPSRVSSEQLDEIRRRIDSAVLLFKVRVMGEELRQRQLTAPTNNPQRQIPISRTS
jgi:hypothetical protein